ncbi:MAG: sterol desaturase family protein, partial [Lutibacter sp.]|nr:sterol desaturase family protein [Lutibacter sp.]
MELPQIPNLIYYAIPFFIVTVIVEGIAIFKKNPEGYNIKDTFASLSMGVGNVLVNLLSKLIVVFVITFLYENFRLATIPFTWWAWLLILFADDFCYYWFH